MPKKVTPRENEVLEKNADGLTMKEISSELYVSPQAVIYHLKSMMDFEQITLESRLDKSIVFFLITLFICFNSHGQDLLQLTPDGFESNHTIMIDMDMDGDEDIVVLDLSKDEIIWLENDSTKKFPRTIIQSSGINFRVNDIDASDLDNDGDIDFIVATGGKPFFGPHDGELYRLENNGNGTYTKWLLNINLQFNQSALADFNGDQLLDIVSTDNFSTHVYLADGFGNYNIIQIDSDNDAGNLVIAEDVDGDLDIDVIIGSNGLFFPPDFKSGSKILVNDGLANFHYGTPLESQSNGVTLIDQAMHYVDLNNDNVKDIVAFSTYATGGLYFLDGADGYKSTKIDQQNIDCGGDFQVLDIDGNGLLDIIRQQQCDNTLSILFQKHSIYSIDSAFIPEFIEYDFNSGNARMDLGDLDGDGDVDLVSSSHSNQNDLSWWENTNGNLYRHFIYNSIAEVQNVQFGDYDNDGDLDVLTAGAASGIHHTEEIVLYINEGAQIYTNWRVIDGLNGAFETSFEDVDYDGDLDIVGTGTDDTVIVWLENSGLYHSMITHEVDHLASGVRGIITVDIDGDGDSDFITSQESKIVWYKNNGMGIPYTKVIVDGAIDDIDQIKVHDFDQDGNQDIIAISENIGNSIVLYTWDGGSGFAKEILKTGVQVTDIQVLDINGNNHMDFVVSSSTILTDNTPYGIMSFVNTGQGVFSEVLLTNDFNGEALSIELLDLDADGDKDIIAGISGLSVFTSGYIYSFLNHNGSYQSPVELYTASRARIVDIDSDEMSKDIVFCDYYHEKVFVLEQDPTCHFVLSLTGPIYSNEYKAQNTIESLGTIGSGNRVLFDTGMSTTLSSLFTVEDKGELEIRSNGCN